MSDNQKLYNKIFKYIFIVLLIVYLGLFVANNSGYYSFTMRNRKELTDSQIKKFEEDVKNGIEIDLNDYLNVETISYQNNISRLGYDISNFCEGFIKHSVYKIFDLFSDLIEE